MRRSKREEMRTILIGLALAAVSCITLGIHDYRAPHRSRLVACLKRAHSYNDAMDCDLKSRLECVQDGFEPDCATQPE